MGIRIERDSDDCEDDYRLRRTKRVRISESHMNGISIFSPTSDRLTLIRSSNDLSENHQGSSSTTYHRHYSNLEPLSDRNATPLESAVSGRLTTLRRRNAIRRRYLQTYPYDDGEISSRLTRGFHSRALPMTRDDLASDDIEDDITDATGLLSAVRDTQSQPDNLTRRATFYDLWQSREDIPSDIASNPWLQTPPVFDILETPFETPILRNFRITGRDEDEDNTLGRVLPIIPPPRETASGGNTTFDMSVDNRYLSFGYNHRLRSAFANGGFQQREEEDTISPDKICLPHISALIADEEQLLYPRNEELLQKRAARLSKEKYGKVMASGMVAKQDIKVEKSAPSSSSSSEKKEK